MDFKFIDAETIKTKFVSKTAKKEKTLEEVRSSISKTLMKMIDGTRTNKKGETISTTNKVLRRGSGPNVWDFQILYGTVRAFGGELTATTEQQAKDKLKAFAEEIRTGKGLDVKVNTAIKNAIEKAKARGEKAAAKRKMNKKAA
jgi:hypothetical protein